jgi:hypothetical protein
MNLPIMSDAVLDKSLLVAAAGYTSGAAPLNADSDLDEGVLVGDSSMILDILEHLDAGVAAVAALAEEVVLEVLPAADDAAVTGRGRGSWRAMKRLRRG